MNNSKDLNGFRNVPNLIVITTKILNHVKFVFTFSVVSFNLLLGNEHLDLYFLSFSNKYIIIIIYIRLFFVGPVSRVKNLWIALSLFDRRRSRM